MITILSLIIVLLVGLCVWLYLKPVVVDMKTMALIGRLTLQGEQNGVLIKALREQYEAMEIGQQELVDNYENDFLQMSETMEHLKKVNVQLTKDRGLLLDALERHENECLPVLGDMLPSLLVHNHSSEDTCDEHDCTTDRYVDGKHVFTDKIVDAVPAEG